ncbi:YbaB/EbfC family nucleoid-associated protein [Stieleria varia]|uniref:Nucleoid-associated protein n=1 Tax=Stieleria varia TaxID=2528005 RepID=A0A5C6ARQ6_9BACT|nr:YbaB/EbfC family nucleoid-associated protein [Stieleria varia]TWU02693.1 hypothetical protein Pla52n_37510 [Stieleria varia]
MFKGLGNLGNIASMVGAFQELPQRMQELNARMQLETVSASSSCGNVSVTMTCVGKLESVSIRSDDLEKDVIEQAVLDATNQAGAAAKQRYAEAIREMASDMNLNIPGIEGMISSMTGNG